MRPKGENTVISHKVIFQNVTETMCLPSSVYDKDTCIKQKPVIKAHHWNWMNIASECSEKAASRRACSVSSFCDLFNDLLQFDCNFLLFDTSNL